MTTFYKLTNEEVMEMQKLSGSEIKVLLFLRTLAPFGDQAVRTNAKSVATELGLHPKTVTRALKELDRHGFLNLEFDDFTATIHPFKKKEISISSVGGQNDSSLDKTVPEKTKRFPKRQNGSDRSPEPAPSLDSTTPQTNKINKTIQKRERGANFSKFSESNPGFRNFCIRKSQELPDRPVLIESWITANFEELKGLWLKQQNSGVDQSSAVRQGSPSTPPKNFADAVEQTQKFPRVEEAIAAGELRQDSLYRDAVFDNLGNWWKKADWEAQHEPAI